jgi:AcrR family transcriptional regulator
MEGLCVDKKGSRGSARGFTKGNKTQEEIVGCALRIAAIEGLGALSIGRLATALRMSKSGLFVHFGSKEKLEIAVVERAYEIFCERILLPAEEEVRAGIERVWALCDRWLKFVEKRVFPGGYFFTGAFWERATQDGKIARRIRQIADEWLTVLRGAIEGARGRGEMRAEVDAERTAFELNSLLIGAQWSYLLEHADHSKARSAILAKLGALATEDIPATAFDSVGDWKQYLEDRPE